VDLICLI